MYKIELQTYHQKLGNNDQEATYYLTFDYSWNDDVISQHVPLGEVFINDRNQLLIFFSPNLDGEANKNKALTIMKKHGLEEIYGEKAKEITLKNLVKCELNTLSDTAYVDALKFVRKNRLRFNTGKDICKTRMKIKEF